METSLKALVYAVPSKEAEGGFELELVGTRHKWAMGDETIEIQGVNCYVNLPTLDRAQLAKKALETLIAKKQRVMAEAEVRCQELQKHIDQLLLLPYL